MPDINPIPKIAPLAGAGHAPERVGERAGDGRRQRKRLEGDQFELHPDESADEEMESVEAGDPVETPVHIDFKA